MILYKPVSLYEPVSPPERVEGGVGPPQCLHNRPRHALRQAQRVATWVSLPEASEHRRAG